MLLEQRDFKDSSGRGNHSVTWPEGCVTKQLYRNSMNRWRAAMVKEKKGSAEPGGTNPQNQPKVVSRAPNDTIN